MASTWRWRVDRRSSARLTSSPSTAARTSSSEVSSPTTPTGCCAVSSRSSVGVLRGAPAQHVGADVSGDHGEPGIEAPLACEARQRLPGAGECFLRRVLGLVTVVQPAEAEAEEPLVVARVEVSECCGIAGLTALDERAVTVEVDVVAEACQLFFAERQLNLSLPPVRPLHPGGNSHYVRVSRLFESLAPLIYPERGLRKHRTEIVRNAVHVAQQT